MAFDMNFFQNLEPETVRGKFYRKSEIDAVLKEISARAELQNKEQELLSFKLEKAKSDLKSFGEAGDKARNLAQGIIEDANELAAKITEDAKQKAQLILEKAQSSAKSVTEAAEKLYQSAESDTEARKDAFIDAINLAWREFSGMETSEEETEDVPEDIGQKLDAIAQALGEIGPEEEEE